MPPRSLQVLDHHLAIRSASDHDRIALLQACLDQCLFWAAHFERARNWRFLGVLFRHAAQSIEFAFLRKKAIESITSSNCVKVTVTVGGDGKWQVPGRKLR